MNEGIQEIGPYAVEAEIGRPRRIGTLPPTLPGTYPFAVAPDGTRFLTIRAKSGANRSTIRLVEHWAEGGPVGARP